GHAAAQYYVGHMYAKGKGVGKDEAKAVGWYRRSAEAGYARSQYKLSVAYAKGAGGLEKNEAEARGWLLKAAEGGSRSAQEALAKAYKTGRLGFARDKKKANYWLKQSKK
ncbi:MAG: tetratricopeptide repeat protein, partial [Acidiferrobacterales bacterium]